MKRSDTVPFARRLPPRQPAHHSGRLIISDIDRISEVLLNLGFSVRLTNLEELTEVLRLLRTPAFGNTRSPKVPAGGGRTGFEDTQTRGFASGAIWDE